jgi:hypothetical protein
MDRWVLERGSSPRRAVLYSQPNRGGKLKYISVGEALTVLSIIVEEDSLGFEDDADMSAAVEQIQTKIEAGIKSGEFTRDLRICTFR